MVGNNIQTSLSAKTKEISSTQRQIHAKIMMINKKINNNCACNERNLRNVLEMVQQEKTIKTSLVSENVSLRHEISMESIMIL